MFRTNSFLTRVTLFFCAAAIVFVYLFGLQVKVMDIDAAQYAAMSRQMADSGEYLRIMDRGDNYLDKPPLLFWLSATSLRLFGVSDLTYKLPSLLFTMIGIFSAFGLGSRLYDKRTGLVAAAMLATCQAIIYINNDVRTDTILAGSVIFAIWQLFEFITRGRWLNLLLGALGIGAAMLSKGPIGLMVPVCALGAYIAVKRDWKKLLDLRWLIGIAIVAGMLAPMVWGLWNQHGRHGVDFYFWTQSFGRITGQSEWKDSSSCLYFTHTFLWAFLPWSAFAVAGVISFAKRLWKERLNPATAADAMLFVGIIIPFIVLSMSRYKLPHYIFVFFPLVAILSARYIVELADRAKSLRWLWIVQLAVVAVALIICILFMTIVFPTANPLWWGIIGIWSVFSFAWLRTKMADMHRILVLSFLGILGFNLILNGFAFPQLLHFQSSTVAAREINRNPLPNVFTFTNSERSFDFYMRRVVPMIDSTPALLDSVRNRDAWVYTSAEGYAQLVSGGIVADSVIALDDFHVTMVNMPFLYYKTRPQRVGKNYLLRFNRL